MREYRTYFPFFIPKDGGKSSAMRAEGGLFRVPLGMTGGQANRLTPTLIAGSNSIDPGFLI